MVAIIGLNIGHDAGVAVVENGTTRFAANEERYSRIKGHVGFPFLALEKALEFVSRDEVAEVAVEGRRILQYRTQHNYNPTSYPRYIRLSDRLGASQFFLGSRSGINLTQTIHYITQFPRRVDIVRQIQKFGLSSRVNFYDHHAAHNASAALSIAQGAGIAISIDASGEGWCSKAFYFDGFSLKHLPKFDLPSYFSVANLYKHITYMLGYKPLRHEGKITGLAAYGNFEETELIISKYFRFDEIDGRWINRLGYGLPAVEKLKSLLVEHEPADIAAGVQRCLEINVLKYLGYVLRNISNDSSRALYLSGGLFANVKLNQRIAEAFPNRMIYITQNMGDGGLNLGAAALATKSPITTQSLYLGDPIDSHAINDLALRKGLSIERPRNLAKKIASLLNENQIIALVQGRMEYGPRALCNRSILYKTSDRTVNTWLNNKLSRTEFMPFAPVIRDVDSKKFFQLRENLDYSWMTATCDVSELAIQHCPAVVHVDNTARPQIISKSQNFFMYEILTEFAEINESPVLVNTSFNMHEEPIVRTAENAIDAFISSGIDYLVLEDFLIRSAKPFTS
jgi:carbamoyltransferase